jgi:adenylate cyclase
MDPISPAGQQAIPSSSTIKTRLVVRSSIAFKVFGAIVVLMLLMAVAAAISMWEARAVGNRLARAVDVYIPTYAALARANVRSLEQALLVRRIVIAHLSRSPAPEGEDPASVAEKGKLAAEELASARKLLADELANSRTFADVVGLARLDTRLEGVQSEIERLALQQGSLLKMLATDNVADVEAELEKLEALRNDLNAHLDGVRTEMRGLLEAAASRTQAEQRRVVLVSLLVAAFAGVLGLALAGAMTVALLRPVRRLLAATRSVEAGALDIQVPVTSSDEIGRLTESFNRMVGELRGKARIRETFGKYVDPRIVESLVDRPELLSSRGERRVMTIYFSDIKGFTEISEGLTPVALVNLLNHYLTAMSEPIRRNGGILDKYIGDSMMAFWGPPFSPAHDQARLACAASLEQLALLPSIHAALPEVLGVRHHLPQLETRIGIATGDVVVGNIGSAASMSYTVVGDTVNLASRLEGASKVYGTHVLVNATTMSMAEDAFEFREIDTVLVAGKAEPERIFELLGPRGHVAQSALDLAGEFASGLAAYRRRAWSDAETAFRRCLELAPDDGPSRALLQRTLQLARDTVPGDWNGAWRLSEK